MNAQNAAAYLPLVQALAEGKTIQLNSGSSESPKWEDMQHLDFSCCIEDYRIKPWSLSRHIPGFRELAEGEDWHRQDFTEDMLPEGWRPLLKGENLGVDAENFMRDNVYKSWVKNGDPSISNPEDFKQHHFRTRRPLPPLPEPVRTVPLEASDVPPGSVIGFPNQWCMVTCVTETGFQMGQSEKAMHFTTWKDAARLFKILRPGSTEWQPCTKEVRS